MPVVWKFPLVVATSQAIEMPAQAQILRVGYQSRTEQACLWALVDPSNDPEKRTFEVYGTGEILLPGVPRTYVGSFTDSDDLFLFHVFEVVR